MTTKRDSSVDQQSPSKEAGLQCFDHWHFPNHITGKIYAKAAQLTGYGKRLLDPKDAEIYQKLLGNSFILRPDDLRARFYASKMNLAEMIGHSRLAVAKVCSYLVKEGWIIVANDGKKDIHGCFHYFVLDHKTWSDKARNKGKCYPETRAVMKKRAKSKTTVPRTWPDEFSEAYLRGLRAHFGRTNEELQQLLGWFRFEFPEVESRHIRDAFKIFIRDKRADLAQGITHVFHPPSKTSNPNTHL